MGLSRPIPEPDHPASAPPVFVTGIQVHGIPQAPAEVGETSVRQFVLRLNHNLTNDFVGLSFAAGDLLRCQYRLGGADQDWSAPGTINFTCLSRGTYTFRVRAVNSDGTVSRARDCGPSDSASGVAEVVASGVSGYFAGSARVHAISLPRSTVSVAEFSDPHRQGSA
jgi:hypothetical protein